MAKQNNRVKKYENMNFEQSIRASYLAKRRSFLDVIESPPALIAVIVLSIGLIYYLPRLLNIGILTILFKVICIFFGLSGLLLLFKGQGRILKQLGLLLVLSSIFIFYFLSR